MRINAHMCQYTQGSMPNKFRGFTMIEVLISMLVLAVGILGLIAIESLTMQSVQTAYQRSQATMLVYDMADRIRTNPDQIATYTGATTGTDYACSSSSTCTSVQLAQKDFFDWQAEIGRLLPMGTGDVAATAGDEISVSVSWDWNKNGAIAADENVSMEFTP